MRRPERWWPVAVLVVAALIVVFVWKPGGGAVASLTCQAERGDFVVATGSQGELAAVRSVAITGPRGWNNKVVHLIDEGTRVSPGDTLALFDTAEQTQRVEERRTAWEGALADLENQRATGAKNLAEKEASLRRQELSLEQARLQVEAMKFESASRQREAALDLRRSELDVEQARQELVSQREINAAELAKAEAEVRSERLDYDRAAEQLASMTITAPDSGMVVYRKIWAGGETRKVRVGDQVWQGQPIMELPDLTSFQVNAWVQEVDVHRLEVGQRVDVSVDAFEGRALSGEITRIAPLARTEGDDKLKVFDVEVLVSGDLDGLLPGMTAQCRIIHEELSDVVHVPLEAVFRQGERTVVYAADGSARAVELGPTGDDRVVVTTGVAEGDVLRLSDPGDQEEDAAS